jgi:hypothetical protein
MLEPTHDAAPVEATAAPPQAAPALAPVDAGTQEERDKAEPKLEEE